jgi:hypothetical protein
MIHIPAQCLENKNGKHNTRSPTGDSPTCHKRPNSVSAVEDSLGAAAYRALYEKVTGTSTRLAGQELKNATIPVLAAAFLAIADIQPPEPSVLSGAEGCIRKVLDGDGVVMMHNNIVSPATMQSLRSLDQPALSALLSFATESLLARWSDTHANKVPLLLGAGIEAVRSFTWPITGAWDTMGHVYVIMNEGEMAEWWPNAGTAGGLHPKIYVGLASNTAVRKRYRKAGDKENGTGYKMQNRKIKNTDFDFSSMSHTALLFNLHLPNEVTRGDAAARGVHDRARIGDDFLARLFSTGPVSSASEKGILRAQLMLVSIVIDPSESVCLISL